MTLDTRTPAEIAYDSTRLSPLSNEEKRALGREADQLLAAHFAPEDTDAIIAVLSEAERYAALDDAEALVGRVYGLGLSPSELVELAGRLDAAIAADLAAAAEMPPDVPMTEQEEVLARLVLSQYEPWADIFTYADALRAKQRGA